MSENATTEQQDERIAELEDACYYVIAQIEYLQKLWGKEGVTDGIIDRLREVLKGGAS